MRERGWTVGVDFGGTNIKVGSVTASGRVTRHVVLATRAHATPARFVEGLRGAIRQLARAEGAGRRRLRGVGVGAPGLMDGERGVIYRLVNVPGGWPGLPLARLLERRLGCPCAVDNDVNVVALGEWRYGAGRGTRHSVYLTLGTGVGGGLVINGALVRGAAGSAGEIGHTVIDPEGPPCACGSRGCLEALIGTAAILRRARQAMRDGSRTLAALANRQHGRLSPALVSAAARAADPAARRIWRDVGVSLGIALSNTMNLLNPERIVVGGGVANAWRWFSPSMRATVRRHAFAAPRRVCRIVRASLGDRAGIVGGAILVWEQRGA